VDNITSREFINELLDDENFDCIVYCSEYSPNIRHIYTVIYQYVNGNFIYLCKFKGNENEFISSPKYTIIYTTTIKDIDIPTKEIMRFQEMYKDIIDPKNLPNDAQLSNHLVRSCKKGDNNLSIMPFQRFKEYIEDQMSIVKRVSLYGERLMEMKSYIEQIEPQYTSRIRKRKRESEPYLSQLKKRKIEETND
jgi:hypothetical protein